MLRQVAVTTALAIGLTASLLGQSAAPAERLSFEVASIKPSPPESSSRWSVSGTRQTFIGTSAGSLIGYAFSLHDYEIIGGPPWLRHDRFDVIAQADGKATTEEFRLMMQSLLEDRFALKAHRDTRQGSVYRLIIANKDGIPGPHLLKADRDCGAPAPASVPWAIHACHSRMGPADMVMGAQQFSHLISTLESLVDRRIINETGLNGRFDVKLEWSRDERDVDRPSIFTAIQEQLGLKLESSRGAVRVLIIDSISRPTSD